MRPAYKVLLPLGLAALVAGGTVALFPSLLGDRAEYSQVVSIMGTREYQDPALLEKAWALPVAALYRINIEFQRNASLCGPATIVNVLRSFGQSADQAAVLQGAGIWTVMGYLPRGVTLDQLAEMARPRVARNVTVLRDLDLARFREHLQQANSGTRRYVVNFTRGPLFGSGGGHHSPVAGYLVDEDLVLVLDVNENYRPWLVKSARLYEAMNTVDTTADKKRGMLLIE